MSDETKDVNEVKKALPPDTWVFTVNTQSGHVMLIGPERQVEPDEIATVITNMVILLGRLGDMIIQKAKAPGAKTPQSFFVEPKGQHKDN